MNLMHGLPMTHPKILFLLVNYFNDDETCSFVTNQIFLQTLRDFEILIIDNGSNDRSKLEALAGMHPEVTLVGTGKNQGYIGGACFGLRKFLEAGNALPALVIVSNTDIEFVASNFLENLCSISLRQDFDLLGPDVFSDLLSHHQNPLMRDRISLKKLRMLTLLSSSVCLHYLFLTFYYSRTWIMSGFQRSDKTNLIPCKVYGIHGSFMVFNNTFFQKGGSLETPLTLFGEEIFFAELALEKNMTVLFDPSLKIIHHEHSTTRVFKSRKAVRQLHSSYLTLLAMRVEQDGN